MTELREKFEALAYKNKWNICKYPKSDHHMKEGQYCDEFVDGAWHGWIQSANREGYKLVPVEPNFETMQEMNAAIIENISETPKYRMQQVYKAMIGACDD